MPSNVPPPVTLALTGEVVGQPLGMYVQSALTPANWSTICEPSPPFDVPSEGYVPSGSES